MKGLEKNIERVEKKIKAYLVDSNEENIHDLRTSLRRFDASFRLLPKEIRKNSKNENARDCYDNLFKLNSEIRDMDIIRSKFIHYPKDVTSKYPNFLGTLKKHRNIKLSEAKEVALSARDLQPFRIKKGSISKNKLQRRYECMIVKFVTEIDNLFPLVVSDFDNRAELHELRKDCKKMRYILEAANPNNKDKKKAEGIVGLLKEFQDILGASHDCDIMLTHLARGRGGFHSKEVMDHEDGLADYSDLIDLEQKERTKLYHQFVTKCGN